MVKDGLVEISGLVSQRCGRVFSQVGPGEIVRRDGGDRGQAAFGLRRGRQGHASVYFIPRAEMLALVERSPVLALALLREISHRLREFNRQYLREVLQAERLAIVGRFARSIVHDLKNPLNIIGLTAEMAGMDRRPRRRCGSRSTDTHPQASRAHQRSDQRDPRLHAGRRSRILCWRPRITARSCTQLFEELRPEAGLKSATLELENPPPSVELLHHPKRLRRVFYNLMHNATDAMPEGGKIILRFRLPKTKWSPKSRTPGRASRRRSPTNCSKPSPRYGKAHGTGLGLSICKRIIEDHQGRISARNEPGRGAVFSFGLPLPRP